ncbi:DUF389 domain-containing protein [Streptacidiphilus cavernicola]|uniref:DUF389 domain-containing protein n=1 Tax=Streptacidiphilus cavernicola TaxID=3342716 RepID=A0ABV6W5X7_9ACTN
MMHLRLTVPPELEAEVRGCLDRVVGVAHIAVLPGASRDPAGSLVLCDVARESADELLVELRGCGLPERGAIAMADAGLVLSAAADRAEAAAPGEGADAVVWESVADITSEESRLSVTYLAFMVVATMIAACGVMIDNSILIVGAMVVGPDFGPLAGVCVAAVRREPRAAGRSLLALVLGFVGAIVLTWLFSLLMNALGLFTRDLFEAPHPATQFIWQPDAFSIVVAVLAGIAGMLSLTSAKSAGLVGVAISVTTIPAAANAAVAMAYRQYYEAWGSFAQLIVNLVGILVAGVLTLLVQRRLLAR